MKVNYSNLMQSKYFSPAFNSAIFDGPLRIYFAQFHESFALKVYFLIQNSFKEQLTRAKEIAKASHSSIFIMVYPTHDHFTLSFDSAEDNEFPIVQEKWNQDLVIGLRQPLEENQMDLLAAEFGKSLGLWLEINEIKDQVVSL
ncbi:MAG: hypothetical protein AABY64_11825 [Bdellovibrionota bacterium]